MDDCRVCGHPHAEEVVRKIAAGAMTVKDAADALDVTYEEMWNHSERCRGVKIPDMDPVVRLKVLIKELSGRVAILLATTAVEPGNERAIAQLVQQIRGCIMDIAILEKRLQRTPLVQLQSINVQFNQLTEFMLNSLCPQCKTRLTEWMVHEGLEHAEQTGASSGGS